MDTLQNRLEKFLKVYGITMQYFEQQCNIAQGLGKKLSEKSYGTTFKRISEGFPQLNIEWLKTGKGTMINPSPSIDMTRHNSPGDNDVYGHIIKSDQTPQSCEEFESEVSVNKELIYLKALLEEKDKRILSLGNQLETAEKRILEKDERISELKDRIEELRSK